MYFKLAIFKILISFYKLQNSIIMKKLDLKKLLHIFKIYSLLLLHKTNLQY
jgi:hypothetical protein